MHAYVHRETCIQCGLCPGVCPEVFSILPGESAQAITEPVPQEYLAAAQEAADSCPVAGHGKYCIGFPQHIGFL